MEKLKILIVDDNKNNLVTLQSLINENFDITLIEAQSAITALDILIKDKVDLLITDIQMPDMDGFELTELIRSRKKTAHIPIILLTAAYISEKFKKKGFELGVEDYITKPINDIELIGRIRSYLRPIQREREFSEQLEIKIKQRTQELEDMNLKMKYEIEARKRMEDELRLAKEEAELANKAKSNFLAVMSHEIRTPMNAVVGMTQLLLQDNPKEEQIENLNILKFSAENLLVIINDILDFSKIEAGKITFEEIEFNLMDILKSVKHSLQLPAESKNTEIIIKKDNLITDYLIGDPVRIGQIITNLVSNAVKFTENGFVIIEVKLISIEGDYFNLNFSVRDSGIGIEKEKLDNIFESFTQANSYTTRKFGGTGLGLTITRRLIELQNSSIHVESEVGKGSRFFFDLKLKKALPSKPISDLLINGTNITNLKGIRILLAEDNKINQLVALKLLKRWDIEVDIADNGLICLEKLKNNDYDIILMDLQMPELDGFETAKEIRSLNNPVKANIPILALTASAMVEVQNDIYSSGMNDFVPKPFNTEELYLKISKYINNKLNEI